MNFRFLRYLTLLLFLFLSSIAKGQYVEVNPFLYTPQQLIEDILIDSGCIQNVQVTNSVSGNFGNDDLSFGYFISNGSGFPFEKGIVLSTGKLGHVPGPNSYLSDDDAPGWVGDTDLETILGIGRTVNATVLEFDFIPNADNIRFRYIFASEEYQQGDPNTCRYSDAFAFLIKPEGGTYKNIALVPGTNTPVQVTTVHSGIPGHCSPINENYFEGWNGYNAAINFNGQTKVLIAESPVVVNQRYHIKLVIADESNYRYDSAVFLEGGSFNIAANLGPDRSFITDNPLCEDEAYLLDATPDGNNPLSYAWFKNGVLLDNEISAQLLVTEGGNYKVEIDYGNGCIATDEVLVEYAGPVEVHDIELFQCEPDGNGRAIFNLFDAEPIVINGNDALRIFSFHKSFEDAENNLRPISNPRRYSNTEISEVVYARVLSEYGCAGVADVILKTTTNSVSPFLLVSCSNPGTPGFGTFDIHGITTELLDLFGENSMVGYYPSYYEANLQLNQITSPFINTIAASQTIFARISGTMGCLGTAELNLMVIDTPEFMEQDYIYCLNSFPAKISISSGLLGTVSDAQFSWSNGETTSDIRINEPGTYTVTVTRKKRVEGVEYSCTSTNSIEVLASGPASVAYTLEGPIGSQNLIITTTGTGSYQYSLDDGVFQDSPQFYNLKPGKYKLTVMDTNGCGSTTINVYVIGFPKYFTPNNDGINDYWQIKGLNREKVQIENVLIYDRFGKIVHTLNLYGSGWDGTYKGRLLPSSDYWYKAVFNDGEVLKGHFTLKR